jgi:beta-galactosidase
LESEQNIKIYSNCDTVELWLNGKSLGKKTSSDKRFIWPGVVLQPGPNRLYVEGVKGPIRVTDSCALTFTPGTTYRPAPDDNGKQ